MPSNPWLTIVVPTLNEAQNLAATLKPLQPYRSNQAEVIVCDGGSKDHTVDIALDLADTVIHCAPGRALQMNAGAERAAASSEVLLFLHADTLLPASFIIELMTVRRSHRLWGSFDVALDQPGVMFGLIAFMINHRSYFSQICTGDQAIFVKKQGWRAVEGFDDIPLMEDINLSKKLKALGKGYRIRQPVITSSRRWVKRGVWSTVWLMWKLRWLYFRGTDPKTLALMYR